MGKTATRRVYARRMEPREPDENKQLFTNPGPHRSGLPDGTFPGSTPPEGFPIISDIRVEPVPDLTGHFGVQMRWFSDSYGVVAVFPWWDHLEIKATYAPPSPKAKLERPGSP
jgi:hypothetical protein